MSVLKAKPQQNAEVSPVVFHISLHPLGFTVYLGMSVIDFQQRKFGNSWVLFLHGSNVFSLYKLYGYFNSNEEVPAPEGQIPLPPLYPVTVYQIFSDCFEWTVLLS